MNSYQKRLQEKLKLMRDIAVNADPHITPEGGIPHDPEEYIRQLNELNGFDVIAYLKEHGQL